MYRKQVGDCQVHAEHFKYARLLAVPVKHGTGCLVDQKKCACIFNHFIHGTISFLDVLRPLAGGGLTCKIGHSACRDYYAGTDHNGAGTSIKIFHRPFASKHSARL